MQCGINEFLQLPTSTIIYQQHNVLDTVVLVWRDCANVQDSVYSTALYDLVIQATIDIFYAQIYVTVMVIYKYVSALTFHSSFC